MDIRSVPQTQSAPMTSTPERLQIKGFLLQIPFHTSGTESLEELVKTENAPKIVWGRMRGLTLEDLGGRPCVCQSFEDV